ncbi:HNH endonuclease [Paracidovorax avenae]|uniref:HNH endonuclease n=1 Tax=Paracidovorax avenae TaxID=80867 RepID=UPI00126011D1|nr:hypothetical protein [Paracidovorax avenae]
MIKLPIPSAKVVQATRLCISNLKNDELVKRMVAVEHHLSAEEHRYQALGKTSQLFSIPESKIVADAVTCDEMKWIYKNKFSKNDQPCRDIYDKLRGAAKICPLCNARVVGTLDHYLPQSLYADYVLTPFNLVPACEACNKIKLSKVSHSFATQTFHPYFDILPIDKPWLYAEIIEDEDLSAIFYVDPPGHWDAGLRSRVEKHFNIFGLNDVYIAKASAELSQIASFSRDEYLLHGSVGLKAYLERQADSRGKGDPHCWSYALYRALGASNWFVDGGAVRWANKLESLVTLNPTFPPPTAPPTDASPSSH